MTDLSVSLPLTPRLNGIPRLEGRALVLLCSYRGGARRSEPWVAPYAGRLGKIANALSLLDLRRFIAVYRDHYANPRDARYQLGLVRTLLADAKFESVELVVDAPLADRNEAVEWNEVAGPARIERLSDGQALPFASYQTVILVYPDPLGLDWDRLERKALASGARVIVVNGRRRLFTLDRGVRRAVQWRRFLAKTRIVELAAAFLVAPVAAGLALQDSLRGRS
jgi:hypothetical protein